MKKFFFLIMLFVISISISISAYKENNAYGFMGKAVSPAVKQLGKQFGGSVTERSVKRTIGGDSRILAKNLKNVPAGYQAHHIIPVSCRTHPILNKIGFDMDCAMNGIALPSRPGLDPKLPVHRGSHPDYSQAVKKELDKIPENLTEEATKVRVMDVISKFRSEIESGKALRRIEGMPNAWK